MKIILLVGAKNCGKTSTLNLVYAHLINYGYKCQNQIQPLDLSYNESHDFEADLLSPSKTKIKIASHGDTKGYCNTIYQNAMKANCDALIMACNNQNYNPNPAWYSNAIKIQKTVSQNQDKKIQFYSNLRDCEEIISNI